MNDVRGAVLIVEDDADIRESLREILEDEGYLVRCAANGEEGLAVVRSGELPCVILLDLRMPVMDGHAFFAHVRADRSLADVAIVVTTSDPTSAPRGVPVVRKPIDLDFLLRLVAKVC